MKPFEGNFFKRRSRGLFWRIYSRNIVV